MRHRVRRIGLTGWHGLDIRITAATDSLPGHLKVLAAEATWHGINNGGTLAEGWRDGSERYDRRGESMLVAWTADDAVVGVGDSSGCTAHRIVQD